MHLLFAVALVCADAAAPHDAAGQTNAPVRSSLSEYRLNPSDVLDLDFRFTPELNQSVAIGPGGLIALQGVGEIQAAGLTLGELRRAIEQAYTPLLKNPLISVSLKDFKKPSVTVNGEVERPGQYELRGDMTLTEAIAAAGGLTESARHSTVWIFHRRADGVVDTRLIDVKRMWSSGSLNEDPRLYATDVIFVPKNRWSKIRPFIPVPGVGLWTGR
jgi:polysaccharide export outer membrane protein